MSTDWEGTACEKESQWHEALKNLTECRVLDLEPNVFTYTASMHARRGPNGMKH